MISKQFSIGQRVELNSGGPQLTVVATEGSRTRVEWDDTLAIQQHSFPSVCLTALSS
jgi:uncharacterized protein YodC (DUF2158 family)